MQVKSDGETDSFRGLSAGFVKGFRLASQSPVFMEVGANFLWSNSSEDDYDTEINLNMYSINVPLNIGYRYSINEEFSIFPYAGITARGNISGKFTASYDGEKESLNIFDEDDMGDDYTFNRFQVGWQIGFGVNLNRFYLSASFGTDFNELAKDLKISSIPSVTLGINF
jgi:hypothetical protein